MTESKQTMTEAEMSSRPPEGVAGTLDARHYSVCDVVRDGLEVEIRSVRPDDGDRVARAFSELNQDSIHSRFFCAKSGLTEGEYRMIRELDFDTRVMLLVTIIKEGEEIVIGSGSYSRIGADAAEVAFVVEEDYHRRGIARLLLQHLARIARDRGIFRFEADVLPYNKAMLRVFATSGWPMAQSWADGAVHVSLALDGDLVSGRVESPRGQ